MRKSYEIGDYDQSIEITKGKITDASCTCKWSTINRDAWKKGRTLCWHIRTVLINLKRKLKNERPSRKITK